MDGILIFFFVPIVVFLSIVAPLWIILHYLTIGKRAKLLSEEEHDMLEELAHLAEKMETRLVTLEKILDAEDPNWRNRSE